MNSATIFHLLKTKKNTVWLVGLSITIALSQFIIYRSINLNLGKEYLGVWSLIVAATAIGQISNFGFSSSIVRYFPEMLSKKQMHALSRMMGTINLSNFLLTLPLLILLYFPAVYYGKILLQPAQFEIFKPILLFSMTALFLNNLFLVYSYTLDAMEKHHVRSKIQISGWIIFLILSLLFLPAYGLKGIAIAMLIQNSYQLILIIIMVSRTRIFATIYPISIDKTSFNKVISFGANSQAISILTIFFDPLIKYFITKNIGLAGVGNYELANKIVVQVKNLLVNASQVVIPKMVKNKVAGLENDYFSRISSNNHLLAIMAAMFNILVAPVAVYFFSGHFDVLLMQCIILLNIGWTINMLTIPHYFSSIGLDKINKLVIYHLLLSLCVLVGYLFIHHRQADFLFYFAVPPFALLIGSLYNSYLLHKVIHYPFSWLKSGSFIYFIVVSIALLWALELPTQVSLLLLAGFVLVYICRILMVVKAKGFSKIFHQT